MPDAAEVTRRVLFILHRGLNEARNLALDRRTQQVADLTDALEVLPGLLTRLDDEAVAMIRSVLADYERKYPTGRSDYSPYLTEWPVPDRY